MYFFGDIRQLPPVMDPAVYATHIDDPDCLRGKNIFESMTNVFQLTTSHRQALDDQQRFRVILDQIATGTLTGENYDLLMSRSEARLSDAEKESFATVIHLYPTNKQVDDFNENRLEAMDIPVARICAVHSGKIAESAKADKAIGLQAILLLGVEARVMLRKNLLTAAGFVNGALGTVTGIIYPAGTKPPQLPLAVLVQFDRYDGVTFHNMSVPIQPITAYWKERGQSCSRRQLPLNLAFAATIHKSQGLTMDKAAVDIGPKESIPGLTYVALSRVRRIQDLMFNNVYDSKRFESLREKCREKNEYLRQLLGEDGENVG